MYWDWERKCRREKKHSHSHTWDRVNKKTCNQLKHFYGWFWLAIVGCCFSFIHSRKIATSSGCFWFLCCLSCWWCCNFLLYLNCSIYYIIDCKSWTDFSERIACFCCFPLCACARSKKSLNLSCWMSARVCCSLGQCALSVISQ